MSKKCKAYSRSGLGLEPPDSRKAFYAGWDAALAEQPAQQEPVAWMRDDEMKAMVAIEKQAWIEAGQAELVEDYNKQLYTSPLQRQPLTDEQIEQLEQDTCAMDFPETVRAIEAAHGIKGEA